ncbi:hypothetical protein J5N97_029644 [Dioscorea zingiberensis]|uniref:tRNA (guanosine(18)-2'-O)-methyltransferase TARBP1 n=1 Tax=Dioscorea zingiberensis TaxID=325984 RepID=A0A9D5H3H9_9LILI|nr:hypothetical protein J5N97_029644 [Dioscorea zingiberensis]
MEEAVASLTRSFAVVPPAAVPAIVDCVVASSSFEPSLLFSSLVRSFADAAQVTESNCTLSHAGALGHLIKNTPSNDALELFVWKVFVPMVNSVQLNDTELINQVLGLLCDVVSKTQSWELIGTILVPFCLKSIGRNLALAYNGELAIFHWGSEDTFEQNLIRVTPESLPLLISCRILISLLNSALGSDNEIHSSERKAVDGFGDSAHFGHNLLWDLSNMVIEMLTQSTEHRSCAIRLILPHILGSLSDLALVRVMVHGYALKLSRVSFLKKIWTCCICLFSLGHEERIDAYNILSMCFSSFKFIEGSESVLEGELGEKYDLSNEKEFWEEIRRGLVDKDAFLRKQALYVLKISLCNYYSSLANKDGENCSSASRFTVDSKNSQTVSSNGAPSHTKRGKWADKEAKSLGVGEVLHLDENVLSGQDRWKVFILLYEMLEEYGTHLVEAAWRHQVSLFLESGPFNAYVIPANCAVYQVQMDTLDGIFNWLAVLWERGLFHENPQVRCLIMESFLSISWEKFEYYAQKVPRSFVLGPFILGLNDVVHHKDFGVKGVYTSSTINGAAKYFHEFSHKMSMSERVELVCNLASIARQDSFSRAGLMALAFCITSAAGTAVIHNTSEVHDSMNNCTVPQVKEAESSQENPLSSRTAEVLDVLGVVVERSKQHFNPRYRLRVCEQVLKVASSVICIGDAPTDILLHFLSNVPREFTDFTGPLRGLVRQWLTQNSGQESNIVSTYGNTELLESLVYFPRSFIKQKRPSDACVSFDDEDVDAWELEGQRWARVLFLVAEDQHLEPIFMFLRNYTMGLCTEGVRLDWVPIKVLILIQSLAEEFENGWRKYTNYIEARAVKAVDVMNILDESTSLCNSLFREKFIRKFTPMLGDILSYAKSVSTIFWSICIRDTELPHSIKGKLGGPSQRRLASHTTSDVLQAIFSMRTISSIASWCFQLRSVDCLNPSFTFLWEFSWKVIRSVTYDSEAGAELHLAAYESLVYVFKAFTTAFIPLVIDFVSVFNVSLQADGGVKPLLDPLVHSFMQNINDLLTEGVLTRSRRAVLMNWKWLCLDSLLSIPDKIMEDESCTRNVYAFFSDSTLTTILLDIVGSLENAGEGSVLPMLRSVRLVIRLISCDRTNEIIQLSSGVNYQFMMQLVQSSWILHLSCNKRRVAPIAALLSSVLHQSVFRILSMHETTDKKQGPLKWFIKNLLDEGVKSPRTIRLAALHLTGLWLVNPGTIEYYIEELKLLSLYGSVAFDEDFEAELSENLEARSEVSLLAPSPNRELTELFINTEMYARVSVAVLFHKLANMPSMIGEENKDYQAARKCGKIFLAELLDCAVNDKDLAKELYKKFSGVHRRKVRLWQMICILSHFVDEDVVEAVTSRLHVCLYRNNLPAVRQYLETFAIQIYLKFPALAEEQLLPIFYDYNMRPQALSSYVFIATNVILHSGNLHLQLRHFMRLLPPIIPFLTSHHHSLRGFTQLLVYHVLCKLWSTLEPGSSEIAPLEKKCFEDLKSYLAENPDCVRLRASMEGFLDVFDPVKSATPIGVFNARDEGLEFECVPISLMEHVITFLNDVRNDLRYNIAKDAMSIKNESLTHADSCKDSVESLNANDGGLLFQNRIDFSLDFQKKITVQEHGNANCFLGDAEPPKFLLEMEKEDQLLSLVVQSRNQAMQRIKESQQQFIFVASLLDRIPNLAGLARTCEVFKAGGLAVADASIIHDKQFQLISVTAEKWVPIIEVPVCSLKVFLEKKRREGFSILGLEQTANSVPLDQYSFPHKTVLVLGREKEGIPVDIIHVLDACVEIPQLGIIRSLNVHVSGAIALWEYTRQQRSKQQ